MGKHLIQLNCDYCGTAALLEPVDSGRVSLACCACGAPARPKRVAVPAYGDRPRKSQTRRRDDDDRSRKRYKDGKREYRKRKYRKHGGFRPMRLFAEILDEIEDIFD